MYSNYKILNVSIRPIPAINKNSFPTIGKPNYCGGFRVSPEGFYEFEQDRSKMVYNQILVPPTHRFPLCLTNTESLAKELKSSNYSLNNLLFFIKSTKEHWLKKNQRVEVNANVVCSRDVLQMFMCAPYEMQNNWSMAVTRYRNTMYICRVNNTKKQDPYEKNHMIKTLQDSWMKNLKKHCLTGVPEEKGECHAVFATDIGGLKVVFNAPMITAANPNSLVWADLQLRLDKMSRAEWTAHKRDVVIKWWTNCFLVGIENIFIANRDDSAIVHNIQKTSVRDLYKDCDPHWNPCVCGNTMVNILNAIKQVTSELDCPSTVILIDFEANQGQIIYRTMYGRNSYTFVGDWYRNMLNEYSVDLAKQTLPNMAMKN